MQNTDLKRGVGVAVLAILIASIHFWLMSIDFYQPHRNLMLHANDKKGRSTIAALWANSPSQSSNLSDSSATAQTNAIETRAQTPSSTQARSSIFSVGSRSSAANAEDPFISSQKLREQRLRNEEIARTASTQTAIRDLKGILFQQGSQDHSGQKKCCVVAAFRSQANCNTPELTVYYQSIFDSLKSRLSNLAREGIEELCE
jgi:hypothetical protein